jgi:hypothetical protein
MANKVLKDYQGQTIKIDGVCYQYGGSTPLAVDTLPTEIGGVFESCLECALESSSSSFDPSSSSSIGYSESSSSVGGGGDPDPKICPPVNPSNGIDPPPDMIIRVSGSTGANVTWCGETWTPAQVSAMEERRVCPSTYERRQKGQTTPSQHVAIEAWENSLRLKAEFRHLQAGPSFWSATNTLFVNLYGGYPWVYQYQYQTGTSKYNYTVNSFNTQDYLNGITPVQNALRWSASQYRIQDWQFGSHTIGTITYTWRRGDNW